MIRIAVANGLTPKDYYDGALARCNGVPNIFHYLPFNLIRAVSRYAKGDGLVYSSDVVSSKLVFEQICRASNVRVVRTIAVSRGSRILTPNGEQFDGLLPDCDLIIKPLTGERGQAVEMFRREGEGRFADLQGKIISAEALFGRARLLATTSGIPVLLQPRVKNHPSLKPISGPALATVRIVTMFNEYGVPEIVDAYYRTSILPGAPVDNFYAGGILFPIDIASGVLRPGIASEPYGAEPIICHPLTGARVAGLVHPGWTAMSHLASRLHQLFPDILMPGWDIGFDDVGPIVVEGNDTSSISLEEQALYGGIVGTRTLALLAYHARQWLERNEPKYSRWRPRRRALARQT